ncbi:hypothetical protein D1867_11090 [Acidianus infernus]|uniref:Uncharacterized protein n=1 Tax=Acidianus infernus TaxID=12915 RepID=A0A6A9QIX6_ACIIN|nr:hypothetical protein [Acidianus infernus]MUM65773.1 hypothetical protein [Acidianus infernus]
MQSGEKSFKIDKNSFNNIAIPVEIYTSFEAEIDGKKYIGREVSIDLYALRIDFGTILPLSFTKQLVHVYRNTDGTVRREAHVVTFYGKKGISRGYIVSKPRAISTLEDSESFTQEILTKKDNGLLVENIIPNFYHIR